MNGLLLAYRLARRLHRAVRRVWTLRRIGDVIGLVRGAAFRLCASVQTACPCLGSPVTPCPPDLRPSREHGAPGIGRAASWSPPPRRRGWVEGNGEGKIKGPARSSAQHLICRCWETARWPVLRVPCSKALAHRHELRQVLLAFVYAHLVGSAADDSV